MHRVVRAYGTVRGSYLLTDAALAPYAPSVDFTFLEGESAPMKSSPKKKRSGEIAEGFAFTLGEPVALRTVNLFELRTR